MRPSRVAPRATGSSQPPRLPLTRPKECSPRVSALDLTALLILQLRLARLKSLHTIQLARKHLNLPLLRALTTPCSSRVIASLRTTDGNQSKLTCSATAMPTALMCHLPKRLVPLPLLLLAQHWPHLLPYSLSENPVTRLLNGDANRQ